MTRPSSAYTAAGVDIDEKMSALKAVRSKIKSTSVPGLLSEIGAFGGMFASPGRNKVLIASTDGVGTKLKVAVMAGRHDTVGQDIVNHCVNDILVHGAEPLFFLDYFGTARFQADAFKQVVSGLCQACRENNCVLIGGETAEMPGLYPPGEYDLVGTIVGAVDRKKIINGRTIRPGDVLIGLPSTGLHTNGFSLARKIIFDQAKLDIHDELPGTGKSVADVLLAVHKSYLQPVKQLTCPPARNTSRSDVGRQCYPPRRDCRRVQRVVIRGMVHITGGGFTDNAARVLPKTTDVIFDRSAWIVPTVFRFLQERGKVERNEMYRVFNMGIGMVIVVRKTDQKAALAILNKAKADPVEIGWVKKGTGKVRLIN